MVWAWTFYWYVSPQGASVRSEMSDLVVDALLTQMRRQRTVAPTLWAGMVKQLRGSKYRDFYENMITIDGVQHRPFGFMGPGRQEYTVLAYATHKQQVYSPAGVFDVLKLRREHVEKYGGCKHVIKLD
jgi:hypothetical protein